MCVFNTEVTTFPKAASPPIPLWLAHMAWNLFGDPRVDVLRQCGSFFSHDFGLPRTGSSSAVHSGSLDSLHFVPGYFFLLGVGLGFEMEWAEASRTFWLRFLLASPSLESNCAEDLKEIVRELWLAYTERNEKNNFRILFSSLVWEF